MHLCVQKPLHDPARMFPARFFPFPWHEPCVLYKRAAPGVGARSERGEGGGDWSFEGFFC